MALREELRQEVWDVLKHDLVMCEKIADRVVDRVFEVLQKHSPAESIQDLIRMLFSYRDSKEMVPVVHEAFVEKLRAARDQLAAIRVEHARCEEVEIENGELRDKVHHLQNSVDLLQRSKNEVPNSPT